MARKTYTVNLPSVDCTVMGRALNTPELRYTPNQVAVCDLRLVFSRGWMDKNTNQWQNKENIVKLSIWRNTAERVAQMGIKPGDIVGVVFNMADLSAESWTNQQGETVNQVALTPASVFVVARGEGESTNGNGAQSVPAQVDSALEITFG